jgi:hypothetical protein
MLMRAYVQWCFNGIDKQKESSNEKHYSMWALDYFWIEYELRLGDDGRIF